VTRVAFAAGRWIVGTLTSVLALERLTYLVAAQSLVGDGPLGSRTLGPDRPHGFDALAEFGGLHAGSSARLRWKPGGVRDLEANRSNDIVQIVRDAAAFLAGPFDGLFTLDSNKAEKAVNWGIAAVVWYALGRLIARLLLRR
jgi:hypothetical protein